MKTIFFIRHAKTKSQEIGQKDFDRTLRDKGINDAIAMGRKLQVNNHIPDCIYTSTAIRAKTTAQLINSSLDTECLLLEIPELYSGSVDTYLQTIHSSEPSLNTIALVGHNPTITMLVNLLASDNITDAMQTCSVISLTFNEAEDWFMVQPHKGILSFYYYPEH